MASAVYEQARYYEIAFSFVDVPEQIGGVFEALISRHSRIPVHSVLDVCCGPARQLRELARRGYGATGLDVSPAMLEYAQAQARREQVTVETVEADMRDFRLSHSVDFAYILMGSIVYLGSNEALLSHLSSMASTLNPGGLYLIENVVADWTDPRTYEPESWEMAAEGVTVTTTYQIRPADPLRQTVHQTLDLRVNDGGVERQFTEHCELKLFFPEELRSIVELHGAFEFLGYFERYGPQPLARFSRDHNVLLRRRG